MALVVGENFHPLHHLVYIIHQPTAWLVRTNEQTEQAETTEHQPKTIRLKSIPNFKTIYSKSRFAQICDKHQKVLPSGFLTPKPLKIAIFTILPLIINQLKNHLICDMWHGNDLIRKKYPKFNQKSKLNGFFGSGLWEELHTFKDLHTFGKWIGQVSCQQIRQGIGSIT